MLPLLLLSFLNIILAHGSIHQIPLKNECKHNGLTEGTYKVIVPASGYSFYIDCSVDGTMMINPAQQPLYHYHKEKAENDLIFKSISKSEAEQQEKEAEAAAAAADEGTDVDTIDDDLTATQEKSVNATAQYIVYGVIIVMALIFTMGIMVLIYWWCSNNKNKSNIDSLGTNPNTVTIGGCNENTPFIDIRSQSTINKYKHVNKTKINQHDDEYDDDDLNIYDDINYDSNDNVEDGDELIAEYGSTSTTTNKTIKKI